MTAPTHMPPHVNCPHAEAGWCLTCVIALDAELRDSDEKFGECLAWMNKVVDGANQLCGHCKEPFTNGTVAEHIRQCDANPLVAELRAARARLATLDAAIATLAAERVAYERATGEPFDVESSRLLEAVSLFLRAAGVDVEAPPPPDCHGTGAYCKGPCVRHGSHEPLTVLAALATKEPT